MFGFWSVSGGAVTDYLDMSKAEAEAAFREFLHERGPALARLRERLVAEGQNPGVFLDGTVESLVPLWRWTLSRLTGLDAPGATDPASVPRAAWPSWERHRQEGGLSMESLELLDGLVSYLASVVMDRAPRARWKIAHHRIKRYRFNNHPVLARDGDDANLFLPGVIAVNARDAILRMRESPEDSIFTYAGAIIEHLNQGENAAAPPTEAEPLFEIEEIRDERGGYDFEIGLSDEIAHTQSAKVDRLVRKLSGEKGVTEVLREDRDRILVRAPAWSLDTLETWISQRL
jgi:hypothetical protein